jgi:hypothetical protein
MNERLLWPQPPRLSPGVRPPANAESPALKPGKELIAPNSVSFPAVPRAPLAFFFNHPLQCQTEAA